MLVWLGHVVWVLAEESILFFSLNSNGFGQTLAYRVSFKPKPLTWNPPVVQNIRTRQLFFCPLKTWNLRIALLGWFGLQFSLIILRWHQSVSWNFSCLRSAWLRALNFLSLNSIFYTLLLNPHQFIWAVRSESKGSNILPVIFPADTAAAQDRLANFWGSKLSYKRT